MKLVIDIPEEEYNEIEPFLNDEPIKGGFNLFYVLDLIKNGTPLPKGCGRLIDADELKKVYETTEDAEYCQWTLYGVISEIDDAETIIEADRSEVA